MIERNGKHPEKKLLVNNTNCVEQFGNYMQITLESNKIFDQRVVTFIETLPAMKSKSFSAKNKSKTMRFYLLEKKLEIFMETSFLKREEFIF